MDSKRINVGNKFRSRNFPTSPALQPTDYTAYAQGAKKIGVICQDGLMKRKADVEVFKTFLAVSSTTKGGSSPVAAGIAKPHPSNVFLDAVDKFFNFINGILGG